MLELGEAGPDHHRGVGQWLAEHARDVMKVVVVGQLALFIAEPLQRGGLADRLLLLPEAGPESAKQIAAVLQPGDLVLLKGSRANRLERLLPAIQERFGGEPQM
jgi:UDP-N-acetylmuramoyl-tripeptide--D-alanyl-D-alanine ligase